MNAEEGEKTSACSEKKKASLRIEYLRVSTIPTGVIGRERTFQKEGKLFLPLEAVDPAEIQLG